MSDHQTRARTLLDALPIFDYDAAPHVHDAVLNQIRDYFEIPCEKRVDETLDDMTSILARTLGDAECVVVPDDDCIELLSPLNYGVGASVVTVVRIGQASFTTINWKAGANERPSAESVDPPFQFAQLYERPEAWLGHRRFLRGAWRGRSSYSKCRHRG